MVEKRKPMPVEDAVRSVMKQTLASETEMLPLAEAHARILAEDLTADHDVPPFNKSPYDGFAVRSEDTAGAGRDHPVTLSVAGEIGAGSVFSRHVEKGEVVRIMTGAQIPDGCDAVVMLELVNELGSDAIELKREIKPNDNISFQGEDAKKGTTLVEKGTFINPGISALLATFGFAQVSVAKKPRIGIIATGSELLEAGEPLEPGKIRNSNAYMAIAQVERAGGEAVYFGKFNDDFDDCLQATTEALQVVDALITTGGVSVGDYDYMPAIFERLGAEVLFNKVAMRPGSVTTVAAAGSKVLFGLSGNPSACYVGFELFVRPLMRTAMQSSRPHLKKQSAFLAMDFPKANPFTRFVRASSYVEDGKVYVKPAGLDKSGSVTSIAGADVFIVLPGGTRGYEKGMKVDTLLLEDTEGSEWPWSSIVPSYR